MTRLIAELRAAEVPLRWCNAPLQVAAQGWSIRVLPTSGSQETGNQGENDAALVVVVSLSGQRVLVPGDAEGDVLERLELPACAVVELPHHGSSGGLDAALLRRLAPRLAVISVGPNTFGHPTADMLGLLRAEGVACLRTDHSGDVALTASTSGLGVSMERGSP